MGFPFGAPWIAVVARLEGDRRRARRSALDTGCAQDGWLVDVGFGDLMMVGIADRIGVRWTVMFGALMIAIGLAISSFGVPRQLYLGHGLFIGFLGNGGINAPLYVYVSRWFDRRRGSALALIERRLSRRRGMAADLRASHRGARLAADHVVVRAPGGGRDRAACRRFSSFASSPDQKHMSDHAYADPKPGPVMGWPPNVVFYLLCAAAFLRRMPMALPQTHLIAFCSDLGIAPTHGAAMLSVALGSGFLCRQLWGLFDRMGGLATLVVCSAIQGAAPPRSS